MKPNHPQIHHNDGFDFADIYAKSESCSTENHVQFQSSNPQHVEPSVVFVPTGDHCNILNEEEEESQREIEDTPMLWFNRIIMCTFAITFLWSTSLQICSLLAGWIVPIPAISSVISHCQFAYDVASENKRQYEKCVDYQMSVCSTNLDQASDDEWTRIRKIEASNEAFLHQFQETTNNCSSGVDHVKAIMTAWLSGGTSYFIPFLSSCSTEQRESVRALVGDQSSSKVSTYSLISSYVDLTNNRVTRLASYSNDLMDYNVDYLNNKTKELQSEYLDLANQISTINTKRLNESMQEMNDIVSKIMSCFSMSENGQNCAYGTSMYDAYNQVQDEFDNYLQNIESTLTILDSMITQYVGEVEDAIENANDFYDSINGARGLVVWLVSTSGFFGSKSQLCGKSSPNWCSFSKADWFVPSYLELFPMVTTLPRTPGADVVANKLVGTISNMNIKLSTFDVGIKSNMMLWKQDLLKGIGSVDITPDDYDPPSYPVGNISDEVNQQKQSSMVLLNSVEAAMYNTSTTVQSSIASSQLSANTTINSFSTMLLSKFKTVWANFEEGGISFSFLWEVFGSVNGLFYLLDYLYRGVHTAKLVAQFWSRSIVHLPKIQLSRRIHGESNNITWMSSISWCLRLLPFVWFQICVLAGILILFIWIIAQIMVPEYNSYRSACVLHTSNHSFISANLVALSINFASMGGNSELSTGISSYNLKLSSTCSKGKSESSLNFAATMSSLLTSNSTLQVSANQASNFLSCVDLASLDQYIISSCCSTASMCPAFDFPPPVSKFKCPISLFNMAPLTVYESMLQPYYCDASNFLQQRNGTMLNHAGSLQSSIFQCNQLPTCENTCAGPNYILLESTAKDCSCMAEWYGNGYLMQLLVSALIYFILNISRILVCRGLLSIFWSSLSPSIFKVEGECDISGNLLIDENDKASIDRRNEIHQHVKKELWNFQLFGICKIIFGLFINGLWIAMVLFLRSNIEYSPN